MIGIFLLTSGIRELKLALFAVADPKVVASSKALALAAATSDEEWKSEVEKQARHERKAERKAEKEAAGEVAVYSGNHFRYLGYIVTM